MLILFFPSSVIINEVNIEQGSNKNAEFIEIYSPGAGDVSLDGLTLIFFDGANRGRSYFEVDLNGGRLVIKLPSILLIDKWQHLQVFMIVAMHLILTLLVPLLFWSLWEIGDAFEYSMNAAMGCCGHSDN